MLHEFLELNQKELIARCRGKVSARRVPRATDAEIGHGIPMFLGQLIQTLRAEQVTTPAPMVSTAHLHGSELRRAGFTVEQVVHDYGDLCQAITEMAMEQRADISPDDFHALNRCLDDAIAGAVMEFTRPAEVNPDAGIDAGADSPVDEATPGGTVPVDRREPGTVGRRADGELAEETNTLIASAAFDIQTLVKAAMLSFDAIRRGRVAVDGSTAAAHDRALRGLRHVVDHSLLQLRLTAGMRPEEINVAHLIAELDSAATLDAVAFGIRLNVIPVDKTLEVTADRSVLVTVLGHLLQNAFKHTHKNSRHDVTLRVRATAAEVRIDIEDECGGLPAGAADSLFWPFSRSRRTGPLTAELGLALCRRSIEAGGGTLRAQDRHALGGCVFSVGLSRSTKR